MSAFNPKASIVICGYNQAATYGEAIESALKQTYGNLEIIAIDNGSTDSTQEVFARYSGDPRLRLVVNKTNQPISVTINRGVRMSTGDYVSILYADDVYLPGYVERSISSFADLGPEYGVVYSPGYRWNALTGERWIDPSLKSSGFILKDLLLDFYEVGGINPISPMISRACWEKYPLREEFFTEGESVFFRMAMTFKFHYLDEPLVAMRDHASNLGKALRFNRDTTARLMELLLEEPELPEDCLKAVHVFTGRMLRNYGWQGVRVVGDRKWSLGCYRDALLWHPQQILHPRTLAGLTLCALPETLTQRLNQLVARIKPTREVMAFREENRSASTTHKV